MAEDKELQPEHVERLRAVLALTSFEITYKFSPKERALLCRGLDAIADAEDADYPTIAWAAYEQARKAYRHALWQRATLEFRMTRSADARLVPVQAELDDAEAALDAAVRRLAGPSVAGRDEEGGKSDA